MLARRSRVMYFTRVPLAGSNGGSICCRNHVLQLSQDPRIDLLVLSTGAGAEDDAANSLFASAGVARRFIPFTYKKRNLKTVSAKLLRRFAMPWEIEALRERHVAQSIDAAIRDWRPDVLIIEYLYSALYVNLPRSDVRTVFITMNREAEFFHNDLKHRNGSISIVDRLTWHRVRRYERFVARSVDKVVALAPPDMPRYKTKSEPTFITPFLATKERQWGGPPATASAFFVGNVRHYPNRMAVEWITRRLAPALLRLGSAIKLIIIGAESSVLGGAIPPNVELLGAADDQTVADLFCNASVMLCPIENDYGVKFKTLEALAYGTPIFATKESMLGIPHIDGGQPTINLAEPDRAARNLEALVTDDELLHSVSRLQSLQHHRFITTQRTAWSDTLRTITSN